MPRLSAIVEDRAEIEVPFGAETVKVAYRPSAFGEDVQDELIAGGWAGPLAKILLSWDLLGEDDQPYPMVEAELRKLAGPVILPILRAIHADMLPKLRSSETSDAGSQPPVSLASVRSGTR